MLAEATTLPLFPLHTVLFPGMTLPLNIFEPRYRQMLADCLKGDQVFGIALIKEGAEVGEPAVPHPIGTTARILGVHKKSEELSHVVTVGEERFRLRQLVDGKPYLLGGVEPFPLAALDAPEVEPLIGQAGLLLAAYLKLLSQATGAEIRLQRLPDDLQTLAYLAAILLQVASPVKQRLLTIADLPSLLREEVALLRSENKALSVMVQALEARGLPDEAETTFSNN